MVKTRGIVNSTEEAGREVNTQRTRMHSSRMRTGRSLTVCWSLLPGGGGGSARGGGCLLPGGGAAFGGVCSGGCLLPEGGVVCLGGGGRGYPSMH